MVDVLSVWYILLQRVSIKFNEVQHETDKLENSEQL